MNKLHRRIQRNEQRHVKLLCATIIRANAPKYPSAHYLLHASHNRNEPQRSAYLRSPAFPRDKAEDRVRNEWYTSFAMTPKQAAHKLRVASAAKMSRISRHVRSLDGGSPARGPQTRNANSPWGNYFSVKFPMVLFASGFNLTPQVLSSFEQHYVTWQDSRLKEVSPPVS